MPARAIPNAQLSVEHFFQLSLLSLVGSGYLAVAGSGYLDAPTVVLVGLALLLRGLLVTGVIQFEIPPQLVTLLTLAYVIFYGADYFLLSRAFLNATVHLVFFLAVVKILTARSNRDYLYLGMIAFLEILAAAILSASLNFLLLLAAYLLSAIAAFTSAEIRRSMQKPQQIARSGARRFHPRLVALSIFLTCGILVLTSGLFFLLPRTANATLGRIVSRRMHLPGFSNEVTLDQIGDIKNDSSAVMHVRPDTRDFPGGLKWRGVALSEFDGKRWYNPRINDRPVRLQSGWIPATDRPFAGRRLSYVVILNAVDSDALFIAGRPEYLNVGGLGLVPRANDSFQLGSVPPDNFRYAVTSVLEDAAVPLIEPDLSSVLRAQDLRLPRLDQRVSQLAYRITTGFASDLARARAIENHLRTSYGYTLGLPDREPLDPIADFLFSRKKGHCEYFASAMTVMLRAIGIPARIVNGFMGGTLNPLSQLYVIRASDAHSWVEAYLPGRGWMTFDPTPADPRPGPGILMSKWAIWTDAAETFWQDWVLRYDLGRQLFLAERLHNSGERFGMRWLDRWTETAAQWRSQARVQIERHGPWLLALVVLAITGFLAGPHAWRTLRMVHRVRRLRYGQASVSDATALYERMLEILRQRGFQKPAWFTPREFTASLPGETAIRVEQFTSAYNELRFGGKLEAAPRLTLLLEELETGRTGIPVLPR